VRFGDLPAGARFVTEYLQRDGSVVHGGEHVKG
jgi:hypothetical protein